MGSKRYVNLVALCVFGFLNGCTSGGALRPLQPRPIHRAAEMSIASEWAIS